MPPPPGNAAPSCAFAVQDALALPAEWTGRFDLVWSLESGEHMPDKPRFVAQLARACAPRGRVILVTWCHRDLRARERALSLVERALLGVINACYYLPRWCSVADYDALLTAEGLRDVRTADWTPRIAPFWPAVIRTAARPRNALKLLRTGVDGVRSALAMFLMVIGYKMGLIKFGLITAVKPPPSS